MFLRPEKKSPMVETFVRHRALEFPSRFLGIGSVKWVIQYTQLAGNFKKNRSEIQAIFRLCCSQKLSEKVSGTLDVVKGADLLHKM